MKHEEQKMGSDIRVEVILKETIKPSSPTPHHRRSLSLSVFDQFQPALYIPLLLFYTRTSDEVNVDHHSLFAEKSKLLKTSLSEALTHFYPFAGELVYNLSISCNDRGSAFLETQVNCPISNILDKPDFEILNKLIPVAIENKQEEVGHLLLVQANLFECGGMALGISISHKVADASTLSTFIKTWAQIAFGSTVATATDNVLLPAEFGVAASLFPPLDFLNSPKPAQTCSTEKCITRRFVFDALNIAALKSKAASTTVPNPTRVEVLSALIWKCVTEASRSNLGFVKPLVWYTIVNMRKRSMQALTENLLGNFVWFFTAKTVESEVKLESLVGKLRNGIEEYQGKYRNGVNGEDVIQTLKGSGDLWGRDDIETFTCSSWCRFSLYEGADFGWGKPSWVSIRSLFKNTILLMDKRDGDGIEALLTCTEEDMAMIGSNEDLLAYASLNPSII